MTELNETIDVEEENVLDEEQPADDVVSADDVEPEPVEEPELPDDVETLDEEAEQPELAPALVERINPRLAALWPRMTPEMRKAAMDDVVGLLDSGDQQDGQEIAGANGATDGTTGQGTTPPKPQQTPEPAARPAAPQSLPLISDEEWDEAEVESPAIAAVLRKLEQTRTSLAELVVNAINEQSGTLSTIQESRELDQAKQDNARDLILLDPKDQSDVLTRARALKKSGRVSNLTDAIGLEIMRKLGASGSADGSQSSAAREKARLAARSLSGNRRTGARRPRAFDPNESMTSIMEKIAADLQA